MFGVEYANFLKIFGQGCLNACVMLNKHESEEAFNCSHQQFDWILYKERAAQKMQKSLNRRRRFRADILLKTGFLP